jgi:hypothetical protein
MAWRAFNWGSRGPHYEVLDGVYVAHQFIPQAVQGTLFAEHTPTAQQCLHVFHFEAPGATVGVADCQAVCNILVTWWNGTYRNHVSDKVSARRAVGVGIDQFEGATYEIAMTTAGLETSGILLPAEATAAIKYAGTNIGRSRRGHHMVFPQRSSGLDPVNPDLWTQAAIDQWVGDFATLLGQAATAGYPLRIGSKRRLALYPVTRAVAVDRIVDSISRRTLSRGR